MSEKAVEITDANFDEIVGKGVTLVDFWAERCPPCRIQGPIVDKLAGSFSGRATIGKLDVDSNARVPSEIGLMYIPTLIVFKNGEELKRFTGLQNEATLVSALDETLKVKEEESDADL